MNKHFRAWLQNKWMDYKSDVYEMDGIIVKEQPKEYFQRYKWFLKSLYKQEMKND